MRNNRKYHRRPEFCPISAGCSSDHDCGFAKRRDDDGTGEGPSDSMDDVRKEEIRSLHRAEGKEEEGGPERDGCGEDQQIGDVAPIHR